VRLLHAIAERDHAQRMRVFVPYSGAKPIYVHVKLMIVDDAILRVGSANMNNRSMGLDSEADLFIDARRPANDRDEVRDAIRAIRMRMLGARVIEVESGSRTLKDATNEAMRDWMASVEHTHYIIGSVVGPHPFPMIVRDFQSVIGREAREQCSAAIGRLPDAVVACVGGGSNAAGMFYPFIEDQGVELIGVEAGGRSDAPGQHAASLGMGSPGVLHGSLSYVLQDGFGQTAEVHSCSAGLDYPGVGPEHACWKDAGRVRYVSITDAQALDAFILLARTEWIIPALESAHAVAEAVRRASRMRADQHLLVNLSGRGDKDVEEASRLLALRPGN